MADQLLTGTTLIEDKRRGLGDIWSCVGASFRPGQDATTFEVPNAGMKNTVAGAAGFDALVYLPQGGTITHVIIYGSDATDTWTLYRVNIADANTLSAMATANLNTEDTSITNAVVDNENYSYILVVNQGQNDDIDGARIKYGF